MVGFYAFSLTMGEMNEIIKGRLSVIITRNLNDLILTQEDKSRPLKLFTAVIL